MSKADESLCERHREFVPLIAAIDRVSGELDQGSALVIRADAGGIHETLSHELIPHAVGEGRTLFPVLRRVTGSTATTSEMLAEHREISRLTDELERIRLELTKAGIGSKQEAEMRAVLDGLKRAIETHFEQEEKACFEVLKTELSPEEAEELYASLEQATAAIRRTYGCGGGRDFEA
ncbi:MAG TPA: hemerythrin domain-containing protein [Actinomycetota bacterium]|nr:hemerythrin domain-containing protein [Actinomycetota bacterium]